MNNKLKLSDIRKTLSFEIQKGLCIQNIAAIAEERYNTKIDYDVFLPSKNKNLQRDFCWTLLQKQNLVLSVLKEVNIPSLSVIKYYDENRENVLKIIDGKQRLSTLVSFYKGEFSININNNDYHYEDLDNDAQRAIRLFNPVVDIVHEYHDTVIPDDEKILWFEQINYFGTPQDEEHLNDLKK